MSSKGLCVGGIYEQCRENSCPHTGKPTIICTKNVHNKVEESRRRGVRMRGGRGEFLRRTVKVSFELRGWDVSRHLIGRSEKAVCVSGGRTFQGWELQCKGSAVTACPEWLTSPVGMSKEVGMEKVEG